MRTQETLTGSITRKSNSWSQADHDTEFAGAALLGLDARQHCSPGTLAKVADLLALPNFVEML
jgi:hypothetical protein